MDTVKYTTYILRSRATYLYALNIYIYIHNRNM